MITNKIRVITEDFRAIKKADIEIDGITVVAGPNSCGKSTISKLLYFLYKTVSDYDQIVINDLLEDFKNLIYFLEIVSREIHRSKNLRNKKILNDISLLSEGLMNPFSDAGELEIWLRILDDLDNYLNSISGDNRDATLNSRIQRLNYIANDFKIQNSEDIEIGRPFKSIKKFITTKYKKAKRIIDSRPTSVFSKELARSFSVKKLPKRFEVQEFGTSIISLTNDYLSSPFVILRSFYIDTPMMVSSEPFYSSNNASHWEDLNQKLLIKNITLNPLADYIDKKIIFGETKIEENPFERNELIFNRVDGLNFKLSDAATGIKSFSIIQRLLLNGLLDDKTLLILDEPESHLHPQWIVEYAKLIVNLNKTLGVKFFIASHNPDMVSAIRYISEAEGILESTDFYLAKESDERFKYNFIDLKHNIEPIFESFNIALDRLEEYAKYEA